MRRITLSGLIVVLALATLRAGDEKKASVLMQAALAKETVQGDLKGAIDLYESAVKEAGANRAMAAKALAHLGEAYQRLGDARARGVFERIVREFADQKEAVAVARIHIGSNVKAQNGGIVTRQVWMLPPRGETYGNVSPDGRYIAYIDGEFDGDLFLHDFTTAANRRLTDHPVARVPVEAQFAKEYRFSRDGKQLAYSWFTGQSKRYELRVIGLQGSGVPVFRRLFDSEDIEWIGPHDWSPDGKWIAVSLHRNDHSAQIGLVSAQDGSLRVLKSVDWSFKSKMFFSPDGKYLAFDLAANDTDEQRSIFILAIDGSREIPAVVGPNYNAVIGWPPDGRRLLFVSDRASQTSLWGLRFAGGEVQGPPDLIKHDAGLPYIDSMGVTTSGTLYSILWNDRGQDIQQATFDFAQGRFLSPPVPAVQTSVGSNGNPVWSRDGKYLAYRTRGGLVVGIRSVATGEVRQLSLRQTLSYILSFSWASDSGSFVLAGTDVKGREGIFRVDAQTGRITLIVPRQPEELQLHWPVESPDGKFLYYRRLLSVPGTIAVTSVKRDLVSGTNDELVRRTGPTEGLTELNLSPNGRYIATVSNNPSTRSSYVLLIPTTGGEPRELMHGDQPVNVVSDQVQPLGVQMWAPDSQSVFIQKTSGGKPELWRAPLDGGPPSKLDLEMDANMKVFRVHPDGRQIAIQMNVPRRPHEIWVLENFLLAPSAKK